MIIHFSLNANVREAINFIRSRLDIEALEFHYLKIGKAAPLLDQLSQQSEDSAIVWHQHEADNFQDYHFGTSYGDHDAAIINLGVSDENIGDIRRGFWEEFIWKTAEMPLLLALVIPDSTSFGSLSKAQIVEGLSLVRLTDRPFQIFEHGEGVAQDVFDWITSHESVIHRIKREPKEEDVQNK